MQCEKCGRDSPGTAGQACLWCGHIRGTAPGGDGQSPWQTPRAPAGQPYAPASNAPGIPWENAQTAPNLFETLRLMFLEPTATFANAAPGVSLTPGLLFALIIGVVGGAIGQAWTWLFGNRMFDVLKPFYEQNPALRQAMENAGAASIATLVLLPIGVLLVVFVWGAITHVCLLIVGGVGARFEDTIRAIAFVYGGMAIFNVIPWGMGGIIGAIWGTVVSIFAIREMHHTTGWKAFLAIFLPGFAFALCCCCAVASVAGALGGSFLQGLKG